jgi:hypothetical protein
MSGPLRHSKHAYHWTTTNCTCTCLDTCLSLVAAMGTALILEFQVVASGSVEVLLVEGAWVEVLLEVVLRSMARQ